VAGRPDAPSYSAVRTPLRILEEKGHLKHREDGPRYVFMPTEARTKASRTADESGAMTRSVLDSRGGLLLISQFTLFASTKKGTKPSWHRAAKPAIAIPLYEAMIARLTGLPGRPIATGRFGAMMQVALVNDGPVTLLLDSKARE